MSAATTRSPPMIAPLVIFGLPGLIVGLLVGRWWALLLPVAVATLPLVADSGTTETQWWLGALAMAGPLALGVLTGVLVRAMADAARD
jgi:hypothetical protein